MCMKHVGCSAVGVHSVYIVLLLCGEGGKGAMGARIEHYFSVDRAVDVLYDSKRHEFDSNHRAAHPPTHPHTHTRLDTAGGNQAPSRAATASASSSQKWGTCPDIQPPSINPKEEMFASMTAHLPLTPVI